MVIYVILGYLIGFSIVVYWHFHKIEEDITNKFNSEHKYIRSLNSSLNSVFYIIKCLCAYLENKKVIISDEWKISPEEAERIYNAAQIVIREHDKKNKND